MAIRNQTIDGKEKFGNNDLPFRQQRFDFLVDESTGVMILDGNLCSSCLRCVDVCKAQGMGILRMAETEKGAVVSTEKGLMADGCLRCGRCVDACTTGALVMREHMDEILAHVCDRNTTTAVMLCGCVMKELRKLCGKDFTYEQLAAAVRKIGFDHVYSPGWAKAESLGQAADILDQRLGKGLIIMTDSFPAKTFLNMRYPQLRDSFAFYDSMQTLFGRFMRERQPDWKLVNAFRLNASAAETADTGLVDYFVNPRELFRLLARTGAAPELCEPGAVEQIAVYEKNERYAELLNCEGWKSSGVYEEITFQKGDASYKAAVCHNLSQAEKAIADRDQYDVIRVMG